MAILVHYGENNPDEAGGHIKNSGKHVFCRKTLQIY